MMPEAPIYLDDMRKPGSPPLDQRMQLVVSDEFIARIDDWRRKQTDIPSRSEAVRRLVEKGLGVDE